MVTLNQFQHSKYLYRYGSLVATTLLIANHNAIIITPAKRTRDRTVAIDINIIRGAYKTTHS